MPFHDPLPEGFDQASVRRRFQAVETASLTAQFFVNVLDYTENRGVGTGTDAAAVQAAIDDAYAHGGGIVIAPHGEYTGASVTLKANVTLLIDGVATFPTVNVVDNSMYIQILNGTWYVTSRGQFGFQFNNTKAGANNVAIYRQSQGSPALYLEDTNVNMSTAAGQVDAAMRIERRNTGPSAGQARGIDIEDYFSGDPNVGPSLRINANNSGGNPEILVQNTNTTAANAPFVAMLAIDNQTAGSTNNAGYEVRQYQDDIDGFLLRDLQRGNAKVLQLRKGGAPGSGGQVWVNNSTGNNRGRFGCGQLGNRGVLTMWDAGSSQFYFAYINSGAWVLSTSEPT